MSFYDKAEVQLLVVHRNCTTQYGNESPSRWERAQKELAYLQTWAPEAAAVSLLFPSELYVNEITAFWKQLHPKAVYTNGQPVN